MECAGVEGYRPEDWDPEETQQLDELVSQLGAHYIAMQIVPGSEPHIAALHPCGKPATCLCLVAMAERELCSEHQAIVYLFVSIWFNVDLMLRYSCFQSNRKEPNVPLDPLRPRLRIPVAPVTHAWPSIARYFPNKVIQAMSWISFALQGRLCRVSATFASDSISLLSIKSRRYRIS